MLFHMLNYKNKTVKGANYMGEIHSLRVKSPYKLMNIVEIKIQNKPNEHGYLYLKCLIDDSINFKSTINAFTNDKISVYEELIDENKILSDEENLVNINEVNERNSKILFDGIVQNVRTTNINEIYYLEIQALTSSFELDIKEKSRSFQNINMTYNDLINEILKDYLGFGFVQNVGNKQKINIPLFQYKETDWKFLKRIASELRSELYCDITDFRNMFYFGTPKGKSYTLEDNLDYEAFKDLKRFHEAGGYDAGYHDTDYFYYEIKRRDIFEIGAEIYYKFKELYVREYEAYRNGEEIIYRYKLCRERGLWQDKIYNQYLKGASIEGKVIEVKEELVKLHLNIDENQNEDEAAWFAYAPPTGNIMYSMPIIGTHALLYFSNEGNEEPIITGCVRRNGNDCAKTSDTTKRYLGTEHGSEIEMIPNALNIKGGSKEPLCICFDDNVGVTLTSPKKLSMNADDDIIIKTLKNVKINAQSKIFVAKTHTKSTFSIENEIHILSSHVIADGSAKEVFIPYNEGNEGIQESEIIQGNNKGFDFENLAVAVASSVSACGVGAVTAAKCISALCGASVFSAYPKENNMSNTKLNDSVNYTPTYIPGYGYSSNSNIKDMPTYTPGSSYISVPSGKNTKDTQNYMPGSSYISTNSYNTDDYNVKTSKPEAKYNQVTYLVGDENSDYNVKLTTGKLELKGEDKGGLSEKKNELGKEKKPYSKSFTLGGGEEFSALEISAEKKPIGNKYLGFSGNVAASAYSGKAEAVVEIGGDREHVNCKAKVGAVATLYSAKAEQKIKILCFELILEEQGNLGSIGAEGELGIDNGHLKAGIEVAALFGGKLSVAIGLADTGKNSVSNNGKDMPTYAPGYGYNSNNTKGMPTYTPGSSYNSESNNIEYTPKYVPGSSYISK